MIENATLNRNQSLLLIAVLVLPGALLFGYVIFIEVGFSQAMGNMVHNLSQSELAQAVLEVLAGA